MPARTPDLPRPLPLDSPDAAAQRARRIIAGGVDSPVRAGTAVGAMPPALASGSGSRVRDADGREYIDYICAYGPVLLGHGHPAIAAAVERAARAGAVLGTTHAEEVRLAERLARRMPSLEKLRFVNTGTEAVMSAVRLARAFTRREKIVRFEGNYHGHSDEMIFSAGASSASSPSLRSGVTGGVVHDVVVLAYNDVYALDRCVRGRRHEIAAIVVEPVCGNMGLVMPVASFLDELRAVCHRFGIVLIFDEIITGLRAGPGGVQELFGVRPDLTCVGKALGGGLPIAAYGGRADIMALLAPDGSVFQGGTFAGNPVSVAAAHALLDEIDGAPDFYPRLERMASRLADGCAAAIAERGFEYPVVRFASMVDFMFRRGRPHLNYSEAKQADAGAYARYFWRMLERGVYLPPSQMEVMFLTAAHDERDVDVTIDAVRAALRD